jgi:hypothetical protein
MGSLPRKCLVSHSYKDAEICKRLLAKLPEDIEPFLLPPITVRAEELVSNDLISAILNCEGLISQPSGLHLAVTAAPRGYRRNLGGGRC